jgi:hypothetical protein
MLLAKSVQNSYAVTSWRAASPDLHNYILPLEGFYFIPQLPQKEWTGCKYSDQQFVQSSTKAADTLWGRNICDTCDPAPGVNTWHAGPGACCTQSLRFRCTVILFVPYALSIRRVVDASWPGLTRVPQRVLHAAHATSSHAFEYQGVGCSASRSSRSGIRREIDVPCTISCPCVHTHETRSDFQRAGSRTYDEVNLVCPLLLEVIERIVRED